jgi:pSer/pThr/pTyr-binding forkhead associated (FHA) protein
MSSRLSRFEELAEKLVEGSLSRLFSDGLHPQVIGTKLARAMEDFADGNLAPDRYVVYLSPEDQEALLAAEPELGQALADHLVMLAERARLVLRRDPIVEFVPNRGQMDQTVTITAEITGDENEYTRAFDSGALRKAMQQEPDGSTYLIVEGGRHFPLTKTVYTLGRRLDCDVVLADPRVSRRHAQLRWRSGRYVLFDLGSTGGTSVNGHPVREAVLEPGDVFSLGGVDIIFGIEASEGEPASDHAPTRPWSGTAQGAGRRSPETS